MRARAVRLLPVVVGLWSLAPVQPAGQAGAPGALHRPFDEILDANVRDGFVYYLALKQTRAALDRYVSSLEMPAERVERWPREERLALWLNAYNALVLQTAIDRYPIRGRAPAYPPNSIRQIPGAFESRTHRVAGRSVTLDEIERIVLPEFRDPRVYLALGRGATGSGRLRSEAFAGTALESQLTEATKEFLTTRAHVELDALTGELGISAIFGWHESEFVGAFAAGSDPRFASRSPIERAVLSMVVPHLYSSERAYLDRNEFRVRFKPFDWALNDLTGGR